MIILRKEEVNLEKILERFEFMGHNFFNDVGLGYPDIGTGWSFEQERQIHSEDWKKIIPELEEKYESQYDLILASAYVIDRLDRTARVDAEFYKLK